MSLQIGPIIYKRSNLGESERVKNILSTFRYLNSNSPGKKETVVLSKFEFNYHKVNVIYGASGSGKSSLLRSLREKLEGEFLLTEPEHDDFIINLVGDDIKEAIEILTYTGLGEGNLFLRKFSQLSEGQKFRMRIALHLYKLKKQKLLSKAHNLFIDEFGSNLDPSTAKALAKSMCSIVKKLDYINLFVCCNNSDVANTFDYDTLINLGFDQHPSVKYKINSSSTSKLINNNLVIEQGKKEQYLKFKKYHYLDTEDIINDAKIYVAKMNEMLVGIQLLTPPIPKDLVYIDPFFKLMNEK